jgi:hypothetical protein
VTQLNDYTIVAARAQGEMAPHCDYILRAFARYAGARLAVCAAEDAPITLAGTPAPRVLLVYDSGDRGRRLIETCRGHFDCAILIERSGFFGERFLVSPDLPADPTALLSAGEPGGWSGMVEDIGARELHLRLDLIAAAFWFLTRYEEYITSTPERHGRFLCAHSAAPPEMYDRPLVNLWFLSLIALVLETLGMPAGDSRLDQRNTICLTHDVDLLRKYRGIRALGRTLTNARQAGGVADVTGEMRHASLVVAGLRRDPYDSFDELFALKDRIGAASTFFFMASNRSGYDADYRLEDAEARQLMARARTRGDEIALHPSYDSFNDPTRMGIELRELSRASGKTIRTSRQHYLRFTMPETLRALEKNGLAVDSTMGFADRAGFRCGWSGCFRPYDIEEAREMDLIEVPLVAMDITFPVYEKIPSEKCIERISNLIHGSAVPGGAFVFLWHNTIRDKFAYPGYWDALEYIFFAAAGSARFVTITQIAKEFAKAVGDRSGGLADTRH